MGISDHVSPGMGDIKQTVRILTVDPSTRRVEATLKDGAMVQVRVLSVGAAFRWPAVGELWLIRRDGGMWELAGRLENREDGLGIIEEIKEGETKLTGNVNLTKAMTLAAIAATMAPNASLFRDSADGKLKFKDAAGVVHALY